MSTLVRRYDQGMLDVVTQNTKFVTHTTTYSMTGVDYLIRASTVAGAWTLTLPSVQEAAGRMYTIKLVAGPGAGAAPNALTIQPRAGDSSRWIGNYSLYRVGHMVALLSDGEAWHVVAHNVGRGVLRRKGFHTRFDCPFTLANANAGGNPRGTTGDVNMINFADGLTLLQHVKGTQTLLGPIWSNPGLNISQDLTDNDGIEYFAASVADSGNLAQYVIGTDPPFFTRLRFTIADVSGTDDCAVGFRLLEAGQANIDDYNDSAVLNVILGAINIETILNNAATVTTDTTNAWADTATHSLTVFVSGTGVVTYQIDDVAPVTVAAYTFRNAITVVPFFFFLHATDVAEATTLLEWECGYQA